MVNIGRNYWSFDPFYVFSYLGDKDSPIPGFEVSAKVMYWINTINTATSYTSGQEFSTDYLIGQHFGNWRIGANGHFLYQTTDDKQYGTSAIDPFNGDKTGVRGKYPLRRSRSELQNPQKRRCLHKRQIPVRRNGRKQTRRKQVLAQHNLALLKRGKAPAVKHGQATT